MASSYPPNPNEQDPTRDSQGYVPPSQGGYVPPAQGGYVPPAQGGYVPPASGGDYQSSQGGYVPPASGGDYQSSQGGYVPPASGGYSPPPGNYGSPAQAYTTPTEQSYGTPPPAAKKGPLQNPIVLIGGLLALCLCGCALFSILGGRGLISQIGPALTATAAAENGSSVPTRDTNNNGNNGTSSATRTPATSNDPGTEVSAFDVEVGQCFNDPTSDSVNSLEVVECAAAHDNEIFHLADFDAGADEPYPGEDAIDTFAQDECLAAFQDYVGIEYASSKYIVSYYQPSEETWANGDREIICFLYEEGAQLEGTVEGSGQ